MGKMTRLAGMLGLVIGLSGCEFVDDMPLVGRYVAKNVCASLFVEGFDEQLVVEDYITPFVPFIASTWQVDIDHNLQTVAVSNSIFKGTDARALYRPPIGCVSPLEQSDAELLVQAPSAAPPKQLDPSLPWPFGSGGKPALRVYGVDYDAIETAFDEEFAEPPGGRKNTVALLVAYDNQLIAERYQDSIDEFAPLKGYSMSKSLINGLMGVLQQQGIMDITDTTELAEWQNDSRADITIEQLMHMESGLQYTERAMGNNNDQGRLLYGDQAPTDYAIARAAEKEPSTDFNYSSGDNVILARAIQNKLGGSPQAAYDLYKTQFFDRIDAVTALVEHDVNGTFLSAESVFLSARDWARFIQLYMNNGEWNGEQIVTEDWVEQSLIPSKFDQRYAANIWVNTQQEAFPGLPEDTIAFYGAMERFVVAIPSRKAIVVRMGYSHNRESVNISEFAAKILEALPEPDTLPGA